MKKLCCLFVLLFALLARADNNTCKRIIDVGTTKVVPFEETVSPDGAYAIGWTIIPKNSSVKPVDWSKWTGENIEDFFVSSDTADDDSFDQKYNVTDCLIDLKRRTYLALPSADADYPRKNPGFLVAAWSPVANGTRYALVQNDARFCTENLWLITIDSAGMHMKDLTHQLAQAVDPIVAVKRPIVSDWYETFYSLSDSNTPPRAIAIKGEMAEIPFQSDIPKSDTDSSEVDGTVTLNLPKGVVTNASSDAKAEDPLEDDPALAEADHDLNAVYARLIGSLNVPDRAALKKEQLDWIKNRDSLAHGALRDNSGNPWLLRNDALLNETQRRLAELKARIK